MHGFPHLSGQRFRTAHPQKVLIAYRLLLHHTTLKGPYQPYRIFPILPNFVRTPPLIIHCLLITGLSFQKRVACSGKLTAAGLQIWQRCLGCQLGDGQMTLQGIQGHPLGGQKLLWGVPQTWPSLASALARCDCIWLLSLCAGPFWGAECSHLLARIPTAGWRFGRRDWWS